MLPSSFNWCFVCRFKVHVEVINNTGSTTFILFDCVVTPFLGRTVKDLLDGMQNVWIFFLYEFAMNFIYMSAYIQWILVMCYALYVLQDQNAIYPAELNAFVDKRILFKVEVSDANLFRN